MDLAPKGVCMHWGPKLVAGSVTGAHDSAGCGGFQRRSPTGGAANGMPRNTRTPSSISPRTFPEAVSTTVSCARSDPGAAAPNGIRRRRVRAHKR